MTFGYPGGYRKKIPSVREYQPTTDPPASGAPPPGTVQVKAGGFKINVSTAVVISAFSAIAAGLFGGVSARAVNTPSSQDNTLAEIRAQMAADRLQREREREEDRRVQQAADDRMRTLTTQVSVLEVQINALRKQQP